MPTSRDWLYIASSLHNAPRVRHLREAFREHLVGLTYDWTELVDDEDPERRKRRSPLPPYDMVEVSEHEIRGVATARCLLMVMPGRLGTHFEMGVAFALRIPIVILNETEEPFTVSFHHRPELIKCYNQGDAIESVLEFIRRDNPKTDHLMDRIR